MAGRLWMLALLVLAACPAKNVEVLPDAGAAEDACAAAPDGSVEGLDASVVGGLDVGTSPDAGESPADVGTNRDASEPDSGIRWPVPTESITVTPSPYWKNGIVAPNEPFRSPPIWTDQVPLSRWVKFLVLMRDPSKVYFQDSVKYPFHAPFAVELIDPFKGLSISEFDALALHEQGQEAILGAVLFPPREDVLEYGIQLVRQEAYDPEMVRVLVELVRSAVTGPPGIRSFYMPTFEQRPSAETNRGWLEAHGIQVSTPDRWNSSTACYSGGWALGRLRYVAPSDLDLAWVEGRLGWSDVLLTDAVPERIPPVAGIVTLEPSSAATEVARRAAAAQVPIVHLAPGAAAEEARRLAAAGREIVLRSYFSMTCSPEILDVEGLLGNDQRAGLLALKPDAKPVIAKTPAGVLAGPVDGLRPADASKWGARSSNYGLVRKAAPTATPAAAALSLDLWDAFLSQQVQGQTLREAIDARLSRHDWPPTDRARLLADLAAVRKLILTQAAFSPAQRQAIEGALAGFNPALPVLVQPSTNVADTREHPAPGLCPNASGCLADDLDADAVGPSACDPSEPEERGLYRALLEVFAGFYSPDAFLDRRRAQIDETLAGMGALLLESAPAAQWEANGLAMVTAFQLSFQMMDLYSQLGSTPAVAANGVAPEIALVYVSSSQPFPGLRQGSGLLPLGAHVLTWEDDYRTLAGLIEDVVAEYGNLDSDRKFEVEYRKVAGAGLQLTAVREFPSLPRAPTIPTFLVDQPRPRCLYQGDHSRLLANHRLKSHWELRTRNTWLSPADLASPLFTSLTVDSVAAGTFTQLSGPPGELAAAAHSVTGDRVGDSWTTGVGAGLRTHTLETRVETRARPGESPVVTLRDLWSYYTVAYATPVLEFDWDGQPISVTTENVALGACGEDLPPSDYGELQERTFWGARGLAISTSFWWPPAPTGATVGYTAQAVRFRETVISGLTTSPITVRGYFGQTYWPGHHNATESFVFEPGLGEAADAAQVAELAAQDIAAVVVHQLQYQPRFWLLGNDGSLREW